MSAFHYAAANGYAWAVIGVLLRYNAEMEACWRDRDSRRYERRYDPDRPDNIGNTALMLAVRRNHVQVPYSISINQRIAYKLVTLIRKCLIGRVPAYLTEYCRQAGIRRPGTRSADTSMLEVLRTRTALGDRSFAVAGPRIWNSLPPSIGDLTLSAGTFATLLKIDLFV